MMMNGHGTMMWGMGLLGLLVIVVLLLALRPAILGLAVPGMPIGAPGMEVEGVPAEPFAVVAFSADGSRHAFR